MQNEHFDVLIVGAGISGVSAAYHLQTRCPKKTFAILEARDRLGGTWDLFRYPGIRSDSDMYTLGFAFRPWMGKKAIADGASILSYVRDTAETYGIDKKIRYGHEVIRARWSSPDARWTLDVRDKKTGETKTMTCSFVFACAGYYDYGRGHTPDFEGVDSFKGRVVHPQFWTEDIDYSGKRVVVIGSGATAVTLVPALASKAAHVTMLQRSPTYVVSLPERDKIANVMKELLPAGMAYDVTRWKNVLLGMAFYNYCKRFPERARSLIVGQAKHRLRGSVDVHPHFSPTYGPWDQRLCLVPDSDLFIALREKRASVVTDHIDRFTEKGLRLKSGQELDADIVVTATGLKIKFMGGIAVEVDGKQMPPSAIMTYKGMMGSDIPNLAIALGYTNASWTLKVDLTAAFVCRILNHMDEHGFTSVQPERDPNMAEVPAIDLQSGYFLRAVDELPRQGVKAPWRLYQNYALDTLSLRHSKIEDGVLQFKRN